MTHSLPPSPARRPLARPHLFVLPSEYQDYEAAADPDVCLHLPAEECDHRTFRCLECCWHAT